MPLSDEDRRAISAVLEWMESTAIRLAALQDLVRRSGNFSEQQWEMALKDSRTLIQNRTPGRQAASESLPALAAYLAALAKHQ